MIETGGVGFEGIASYRATTYALENTDTGQAIMDYIDKEIIIPHTGAEPNSVYSPDYVSILGLKKPSETSAQPSKCDPSVSSCDTKSGSTECDPSVSTLLQPILLTKKIWNAQGCWGGAEY